MPTSTPSLFGRITAVQRDHSSLLEMVSTLRRLQRALLAGETERGADWTRFIGELEEFTAHLRTHFAAEETNGYFGTLVSDRPSLSGQVDRLRAEHAEMMEALVSIRPSAANDFDACALAIRLGQLLDSFEAHERRENLLIQEFLLRDEGVGGQ